MNAVESPDEALILLAPKSSLSSKFKVGVLANFCTKYKLTVGSSGIRGRIKCDYVDAILLYVSKFIANREATM